MRFTYLTLILIILASCSDKKNESELSIINKSRVETNFSKADSIIALTIKAHGGELYKSANFSFVFRNNTFSLRNSEGLYSYSVKKIRNDSIIIDTLDNNRFKRTINGQEKILNAKEIKSYSNSLNSVIYFAMLPYKLQDEAVISSYHGKAEINNQVYEKIEIKFKAGKGGKDFDDTFYYWINQKTNLIDYLAYNYKVDNGGVRFRSAYNTRKISGIIFQDYINYEAPLGTPLADLAKLYEDGKLKEVSKIILEYVKN